MSNDSTRRLGQRTATRSRARIIDDAGCVTDVIVKDVSPTGVRIEVPAFASLQKQFTIRFTQGGRDALVEVVWRKGSEAGLRYVTELNSAPKPKPVVAPAIKKVSLAELRGLAKSARR
jgi:hypothetical protein